MAQPRSDDLAGRLNKSTLKGVKELQAKLKKDLHHYEEIKADGQYVCSNRFAESVFGHFKKLEETSTAATIENVAEMTISRMNNAEKFLRNMPQDQREELWKQIEDKKELKLYRSLRKKLSNSVEEFAKAHRKKIADKEATRIIKKEAKKRAREEKENITPLRKSIPRKKKIQFSATSPLS